MQGFISGLSILFHWSIYLSMPVPQCFDYHSFVVVFGVFFFLSFFWYFFGPLPRHMEVPGVEVESEL